MPATCPGGAADAATVEGHRSSTLNSLRVVRSVQVRTVGRVIAFPVSQTNPSTVWRFSPLKSYPAVTAYDVAQSTVPMTSTTWSFPWGAHRRRPVAVVLAEGEAGTDVEADADAVVGGGVGDGEVVAVPVGDGVASEPAVEP
ncbi:MAG: hypothetical protein JWR20_1736, partial [Marmoricola sp.]|nr:hypothetical protein [Marmoricola sp.]